MRKCILIVSTLLALVAVPAAANAGSFLFGMMVGSMMASGNHPPGVDSSVIYTADEETMKTVDPLLVRQVTISNCFKPGYGNEAMGATLKDLFAAATKTLPQKERTILQIFRIIHAENVSCADTWFSYIDK